MNLIQKLTEMNKMGESPSAVEVKVSKRLWLYSNVKTLVGTSVFFESMLNLKKKSPRILDLTSFCTHEETLASLIHLANYNGQIPITLSNETMVNLIFLVEPFLLNDIIKDVLHTKISNIPTSEINTHSHYSKNTHTTKPI